MKEVRCSREIMHQLTQYTVWKRIKPQLVQEIVHRRIYDREIELTPMYREYLSTLTSQQDRQASPGLLDLRYTPAFRRLLEEGDYKTPVTSTRWLSALPDIIQDMDAFRRQATADCAANVRATHSKLSEYPISSKMKVQLLKGANRGKSLTIPHINLCASYSHRNMRSEPYP